MPKVRFQVQLEQHQYKRMREEALRRKISVSHAIRLSVDHFLSERRTYTAEERARLLAFVRSFPDTARDVSEAHDRYLYGRRR